MTCCSTAREGLPREYDGYAGGLWREPTALAVAPAPQRPFPVSRLNMRRRKLWIGIAPSSGTKNFSTISA